MSFSFVEHVYYHRGKEADSITNIAQHCSSTRFFHQPCPQKWTTGHGLQGMLPMIHD